MTYDRLTFLVTSLYMNGVQKFGNVPWKFGEKATNKFGEKKKKFGEDTRLNKEQDITTETQTTTTVSPT